MEKYAGVKFECLLLDGRIPEDGIKKYLELDGRIGKFISTKKNEGNMSMQIQNGFLIKRTGAKMTALDKNDISMVVGIKNEKVTAIGNVPSSEARMHYEIYNTVPDARIILHFHDDEGLKTANCPAIGPFRYGTPELANAAAECAERNSTFKINGHGFVIVAGNEIELIDRLKKIKEHINKNDGSKPR